MSIVIITLRYWKSETNRHKENELHKATRVAALVQSTHCNLSSETEQSSQLSWSKHEYIFYDIDTINHWKEWSIRSFGKKKQIKAWIDILWYWYHQSLQEMINKIIWKKNTRVRNFYEEITGGMWISWVEAWCAHFLPNTQADKTDYPYNF
jgi:hypothetical protein